MSVKQTKENPEALWMGKSFMKMPRKVLALSVSASKKERHLARIYMALATMSYFKPGFMKLGRIQYVCHVGEYFCTYQFLADRIDISIGSVGYYLRKLARERLIEYGPVAGGTKIKICNYNYFSGQITENTDNNGNDISAAQAMAAAEQAMGGRSKQFQPKGKGGEA